MKFRQYLDEVKGYTKEWEKFEKAAKREIGQNWNGSVTGDILNQLSPRTKELYKKYFSSLKEAKEMTELMVAGPRIDHGYSKKDAKSGEMILKKIIKKNKGKITDVTDKGHAIVQLPTGNLNAFKADMSSISSRGLNSSQFDLSVRKGDSFDTVYI